eukprot:COSAG04_NODE_96_length_26486_cov_136.642817_2_plen_119_part_00
MNSVSSRSHAIFTVSVKVAGSRNTTSKLHFVDLAVRFALLLLLVAVVVLPLLGLGLVLVLVLVLPLVLVLVLLFVLVLLLLLLFVLILLLLLLLLLNRHGCSARGRSARSVRGRRARV